MPDMYYEEREPCRAAIVILVEALLTERERARLMEVFDAVSMSVAEMLVAKGEARGEAKGVLLILNMRFPGQPPAPALEARVMAQQDVATLERWMRIAMTCTSMKRPRLSR